MPLYEYICSKCNYKFDFLHKSISVLDFVTCPVCNSNENKKLFSSFNSSTKNKSNPDVNNCSDGSCGFSKSSCSSGLCGLN